MKIEARQGKYRPALERCLRAKKNARNLPENVQFREVSGVSAFQGNYTADRKVEQHEGGGNMPRMPKYLKNDWAIFLDDRCRRAYNKLCRRCEHDCKQSFRATIIQCPDYLSKRRKKS